MAASERSRAEQKSRSLFDLRPDFFDACRLLLSHSSVVPFVTSSPSPPLCDAAANDGEGEARVQDVDSECVEERGKEAAPRWTCNTCKSEFESLQDQRSHFKSDVHRLNVKLSIAGKNTIKEEEFAEMDSDSVLKDFDVSSISGSEDEFEKGSIPNTGKAREELRQKLYFRLHSGNAVSIWRSLILDDSEDVALEHSKFNQMGNDGCLSFVDEGELIRRLKCLVCEPRDRTHLRIVLLASGGHFAGCVFDGNSIVAHKTFHRYVVRGKAGKKQSAKDGTGKTANSAGSSLRRYNEAALKKEIQELLLTWKSYIDSSSCIFIYAPAKNRQMLFDGDKAHFSAQRHVIRHVPLSVHRPTLKEAKRVYSHLTNMAFEVDEKAISKEDPPICKGEEGKSKQRSREAELSEHLEIKESSSGSGSAVEYAQSKVEDISLSPSGNETTPLHEAAKSGDAHRTLELLEQGLNPCIKDARGRTPYMLASEKEVRNTFRRYMASNFDKWDWHAANVPSPLTQEMEDSQAAKQAEKDAKRKAKAKELKKLRKEKEKAKAQVGSQNSSTAAPHGQEAMPASNPKRQPQSNGELIISKEEQQRRTLAAEREKRAAAAERRIAAALNASPATTKLSAPSISLDPKCGNGSDVICSCCNASLGGKIPFHRYNYKYCSTSCMHLHREMLEDG